MKIEVEIPEMEEDEHRCIRVMFGIEERAKKYPGKPWEVKVVRCDLCGKCCMNVVDGWKWDKDPKTGWCSHLVWNEGWKGYLCDFGRARPFSCSTGDEANKDYCCIEWRTVG
jgi:hypothetical protein